jgi:hypothetical protein
LSTARRSAMVVERYANWHRTSFAWRSALAASSTANRGWMAWAESSQPFRSAPAPCPTTITESTTHSHARHSTAQPEPAAHLRVPSGLLEQGIRLWLGYWPVHPSPLSTSSGPADSSPSFAAQSNPTYVRCFHARLQNSRNSEG